jgi:hypothetical protein
MGMAPSITESEIAGVIQTLHELVRKCEASIMVPDLFPGSKLEVLYIPSDNKNAAVAQQTGNAALAGTPITTAALRVIGRALEAKLSSCENDMVVYEFDDGAKVIAYLPEVRNTVLQAVGLTLLND